MKLHPGVHRVELEVEGGGLGGLLLVTAQAGEAVGEGVRDEKVHQNVGREFAKLDIHSEIPSTRPISVGKFDVDKRKLSR